MEVFAFADDFGKLSSHMAGSSMMMMGCLRRCSLGRWDLDECSRVRCNHLARETDSRALARLSHDSTKEWRFKCVAPGYLSARRPGGQVKRYPMNAETSPKQVSCGPPKEETSAGVPKMQSLALRIGGDDLRPLSTNNREGDRKHSGGVRCEGQRGDKNRAH